MTEHIDAAAAAAAAGEAGTNNKSNIFANRKEEDNSLDSMLAGGTFASAAAASSSSGDGGGANAGAGGDASAGTGSTENAGKSTNASATDGTAVTGGSTAVTVAAADEEETNANHQTLRTIMGNKPWTWSKYESFCKYVQRVVCSPQQIPRGGGGMGGEIQDYFVVFQIAHSKQAIKSYDGQGHIRVLGVLPSLEHMHQHIRHLTQTMRARRNNEKLGEVRCARLGTPFLVARERLQDINRKKKKKKKKKTETETNGESLSSSSDGGPAIERDVEGRQAEFDKMFRVLNLNQERYNHQKMITTAAASPNQNGCTSSTATELRTENANDVLSSVAVQYPETLEWAIGFLHNNGGDDDDDNSSMMTSAVLVPPGALLTARERRERTRRLRVDQVLEEDKDEEDYRYERAKKKEEELRRNTRLFDMMNMGDEDDISDEDDADSGGDDGDEDELDPFCHEGANYVDPASVRGGNRAAAAAAAARGGGGGGGGAEAATLGKIEFSQHVRNQMYMTMAVVEDHENINSFQKRLHAWRELKNRAYRKMLFEEKRRLMEAQGLHTVPSMRETLTDEWAERSMCPWYVRWEQAKKKALRAAFTVYRYMRRIGHLPVEDSDAPVAEETGLRGVDAKYLLSTETFNPSSHEICLALTHAFAIEYERRRPEEDEEKGADAAGELSDDADASSASASASASSSFSNRLYRFPVPLHRVPLPSAQEYDDNDNDNEKRETSAAAQVKVKAFVYPRAYTQIETDPDMPINRMGWIPDARLQNFHWDYEVGSSGVKQQQKKVTLVENDEITCGKSNRDNDDAPAAAATGSEEGNSSSGGGGGAAAAAEEEKSSRMTEMINHVYNRTQTSTNAGSEGAAAAAVVASGRMETSNLRTELQYIVSEKWRGWLDRNPPPDKWDPPAHIKEYIFGRDAQIQSLEDVTSLRNAAVQCESFAPCSTVSKTSAAGLFHLELSTVPVIESPDDAGRTIDGYDIDTFNVAHDSKFVEDVVEFVRQRAVEYEYSLWEDWLQAPMPRRIPTLQAWKEANPPPSCDPEEEEERVAMFLFTTADEKPAQEWLKNAHEIAPLRNWYKGSLPMYEFVSVHKLDTPASGRVFFGDKDLQRIEDARANVEAEKEQLMQQAALTNRGLTEYVVDGINTRATHISYNIDDAAADDGGGAEEHKQEEDHGGGEDNNNITNKDGDGGDGGDDVDVDALASEILGDL